MISIPEGILCVGNLTQDTLVWPVDEVVFNTTTWVSDIITSIGGNGANTSYTIAKLGGEVRLTGSVGDDEAGSRVIAELNRTGVDVSRVTRLPLPTPVTVVVVRSDGARSFLHRPGASKEAFAEPLEFAPSVVSGCSHFHLANPFAMPRMRPEAGNTLERARAAGMTTSLDTGWDALNQWMKVIGPCLPHLDLLFVNGDEARMLSGHSDPRTAAQCFRDRGVRNIVIKVGSRGCLLCDGCESVDVPGFPVTAVDTTGAGDCFAGAFLVALQRGLEPMEAARLANAIGALTVQHPGATTGLRDFESTTQWMRSFGM